MTPLPPQDPDQPQLPFSDPQDPPAPTPPDPAPPQPAEPLPNAPQLEWSNPFVPVEPAPHESAAPDPFAVIESPQPLHQPEPALFQSFIAYAPHDERIPNFGHAALLALLATCGLFCATVLARLALHFHLFGVTGLRQAADDIHYTLGTEAIIYLVTLLLCLPIFSLLWHKSFFRGIHWRGHTALRLRYRLFAAAALCFLLAMLNGVFMPGPSNAPIDRLFRTPGAAWLLFGFGVTFAPFFEELAFRGFLLPAFCTAYDWIAEQITALTLSEPPDHGYRPPHTLFARIVADLFLALPIFAFIPDHSVDIVPRALFVSAWIFVFAICWIATVLRPSARAAALVPPLDPNGHPVWSFPAMTLSAVLSSVPFALMHGQQTSYALGPFFLLICVSLVLCWVRLITRSLACSVLVHACYNFLLFSFMFLGTSGFHHLDHM
ncbi:MAG TPA: CPBP family intramembrane glutamic endopeptidase [Terracidiphilus sp.]|nr:CPBP family intramembrane glutamic endopeptidase [Terracidiphilus sp.]